jgi:hypothetical protein
MPSANLHGSLVLNEHRIVTAAGAITMLNETVLEINKTAGAATAVTLPANPQRGRTVWIKDANGDAATNLITITPAAGNVDDAANVLISSDWGCICLQYNGTQWSVLSESTSEGLALSDDELLAFGNSSDARISWDTTDANANELLIQLPAGGAVNVPVIAIGQSIESVDLGLYNGVVDPRIAMFGVGAVTTACVFEFRKARGTITAPTVTTTGDDLGTIDFYGCVAAGEYVRAASIRADISGTIATTRAPGNLSFNVGTDAAPTVMTERLLLTGSGLITLTPATDVVVADATGLIVGGTAQVTISDGDGATDMIPEMQVLGTAAADGSLLVASFNTTNTRAVSPHIALVKGAAATQVATTAVADNEVCGSIIAYGSDSGDFETPVAAIEFVVDDPGAPGASAIGGSLEFYTTADGGSTLTLAYTVNSDQNIYVANTNGLVIGHTAQLTVGNGATVSEFQQWGTALVDGSMALGLAIASAVGPDYQFVKSRNAAIGSFTIVQDNDVCGRLVWLPDDGVDYQTEAAVFQAEVDDSSPAAGDVGMAFVWQAMPGGALPIEEHMRLEAAGTLVLNQQAQDLVHLVLRSSDVVTGATTIVKGGTLTTNDYFSVAKDAAATGGAHVQAIAESTVAVGMTISAWCGAAATTDTSGSLGVMNFAVGEHNGANADVDMAANTNAFTWAEIDAANAYLTRMLLKADDGELHLGNTTLVALDEEDDVQLVRAMQKVTSNGQGLVQSQYDGSMERVYDYEKLHALGIVGPKDKDGFFLFKVQSRFALAEGAIWQLYNDLMSTIQALPADIQARLPASIQAKLLPAA